LPLLADHLGSTTATVFAGTGGLQSLRQYTAWGEEYSSYNVTPTGYRYTSQRWDSGLGLYDYNARYYDPLYIPRVHVNQPQVIPCWGAVFIWLLWLPLSP